MNPTCTVLNPLNDALLKATARIQVATKMYYSQQSDATLEEVARALHEYEETVDSILARGAL